MKEAEGRTAHLIVSDDEFPTVRLRPGKKFEVVSLNIVSEDLAQSVKIAARLCGGTTTCLALIDPDPL